MFVCRCPDIYKHVYTQLPREFTGRLVIYVSHDKHKTYNPHIVEALVNATRQTVNFHITIFNLVVLRFNRDR